MKLRIKTVLALAAVLILGAVLRSWNIRQSFWWDELWGTLCYADAASIKTLLSQLGYYFNNHIFYSLLCRASIRLFGESELTARLPALLLGLAGIPVLFLFARKLMDEKTALIASYFLAISAFHIDHSTEARGYSGLMLFSLMSTVYFLRALRTNQRGHWVMFSAATVLGFYSHVFMIAVSISQFAFTLGLVLTQKYAAGSVPDFGLKAFKRYCLFLFSAALMTLALYSPILKTFFTNLGKVRIVDVDRTPFLKELLSAMLPGFFTSTPALLLYSLLLAAGIYGLAKKRFCIYNSLTLLYFIILLGLPLTLYLLTNPMFVLVRYFIFALPIVLLIMSCGISRLTGWITKAPARNAIVFIIMGFVTWVQLPEIRNIITTDRQNYREAVDYVESQAAGRPDTLVFSLGYAGRHFSYYAGIPIPEPENFEQFQSMSKGKAHVWCLVTAWLPEVRPAHEDIDLYRDVPAHEKIYEYVRKHFTLKQEFSARYDTRVYYLEQ